VHIIYLAGPAGDQPGAGTPSRGRRGEGGASVKLPWRKRSMLKRIVQSDYATGYVVRRAAIAVVLVLGVINLPDLIRYVKIELM
jgi:hypothetical protein